MIREWFARLSGLTMGLYLILMLLAPAVAAQGTDTDKLNQERVTENLAQEGEAPASVAISEDYTIIGKVDEIILTGQIVTSRAVVLRQMTFKVGFEVSRHDLDLCRKRLLGLNGIYWQADITWAPAQEEGHIIVTVDLRARRTWFLAPSIPAGAAIGDRNFFGTGDSLTVGVFIGEDSQDHLYNFVYSDPQFLGGHNSMTVEGHLLDTSQSIRTDTVFSTGESYLIDRNGFSLTYNTRWNERIGVSFGYRWERVTTTKNGDPFRKFGTDDYFYYSGQRIPDGNVGVVAFMLGAGNLDSRFFPTKGYYWSFYNELAGSVTASDFDFTRHTISAATFRDISNPQNVLGARVMYSFLTGDPPNYELLPFDWQVRGYSAGTHRGKSLLAMNFEYRFIAEPDIFQGVLFSDLGRSWDGRKLSFNDLEFGYGFGVRIYTAPFIPYNLLLRLDYGFSSSGETFTAGFNQFF